MQHFSTYFSTLFGIGYFPKAPGTIGTVFAALVYIVLPSVWFDIRSIPYLLGALFLLILFAVIIIGKAEKTLGHDSPHIVLDEFIGYFVAILMLPKTLIIIILAFIMFRVFDIFKPEPVNFLQRLPGGWGVVADDVMAGIYANLSIRILHLLFLN